MLTGKEALRKHREMWEAMRETLGDNPSPGARARFKYDWCEAHGDADISAHCYLCQFVEEHKLRCEDCPIDWNGQRSCFEGTVSYRFSPLSEILALPERKVNEDVMVAETEP